MSTIDAISPDRNEMPLDDQRDRATSSPELNV
jgi:hypothetical protein